MNTKLKNEIVSLVKQVFDYLNSIEISIYYDVEPRIVAEDYGYRTEDKEIPDFVITFYKYCQSFFNNLNFTLLNDLFYKEYPFFENFIKTRDSGGSASPKSIVESIIISLMPKMTNPEIQRNIYEEIDSIANIFNLRKTTVRQYYPITNLSSIRDFEKYEFESNIFIVKLTNEEINKFSDVGGHFDKVDLCRYAVYFEYDEEIGFSEKVDLKKPEIIDRIPKIIQLLQYSLYLSSSGTYTFNAVHTFSIDKFARFSGMSSSYSYSNTNSHTSGYIIDHQELIDWIYYYKKLSITDIKHFIIALNRLIESERRANPIDSVIDSAIALESILLFESENKAYQGELRYRFSINYASLFPKEQRVEKKKFATSIYDLRSKIVHGSSNIDKKIKINNKEFDLSSIANLINNTLRDLIKYFIELPSAENFYSKNFWTSKVLGL